MGNYDTRVSQPVKTISAFKALTYIVLGTIAMIFTFWALGANFIWERYDNVNQAERHLQEYQEKIKSEPNNIQNRLGLGFGLYQKGLYEQAIKEYKKVIELDAKNFSAYLNMGYAYLEMDKPSRAIDSLKKAIELVPKSYQAHFALGQVYYKTNDYEKAVLEFDKAFVLSPNSVPPLYFQGLCLEKLGKKQEARDIFKHVLTFDPAYEDAQKALERLGGR